MGHGENEHWTYDIVSAPSTKFLGNSVEIYPVGEVVTIVDRCTVLLAMCAPCTLPVGTAGTVDDILFLGGAGRSRIKLKSTGELFTLRPCNVKAHNVIVGGVWVDNEGEYVLENTTTGARVTLYFTPCGWFSSGRYEVSSVQAGDFHSRLPTCLQWLSAAEIFVGRVVPEESLTDH